MGSCTSEGHGCSCLLHAPRNGWGTWLLWLQPRHVKGHQDGPGAVLACCSLQNELAGPQTKLAAWGRRRTSWLLVLTVAQGSLRGPRHQLQGPRLCTDHIILLMILEASSNSLPSDSGSIKHS